jgi:hypothetical protein
MYVCWKPETLSYKMNILDCDKFKQYLKRVDKNNRLFIYFFHLLFILSHGWNTHKLAFKYENLSYKKKDIIKKSRFTLFYLNRLVLNMWAMYKNAQFSKIFNASMKINFLLITEIFLCTMYVLLNLCDIK